MKKTSDIKRFNPPGFIPTSGWLFDYAEDLRSRQTEAEKKFSTYLDNKGIEYYAQVPVYVGKDGYIIDFIFRSSALKKWIACEIDGGYHKDQKEKDLTRDAKLLKAGWIPIRLKNADTNTNTKFAKEMIRFKATDIMMKISGKNKKSKSATEPCIKK